MREAFIAVILVLGLFAFGCLGSPQSSNNTSGSGQATQPQQPGQNVPSTGQNQPPGTSTEGQGTVNGTGGGSTSGETGTTTSETSGLDWTALMALGIPLECDVTTTVNGTATQSHVYVQNSNTIRSEATMASGGCSQVAMIIKDKTIYMKCTNGQLFEGASSECVWVKMSAEGTSPTGSTTSTDYSSLTSNDINCRPWIMDPSKFVVEGKACTFQELYPMPTNPYN
ncbi:MAG TPA: hypothetical protein VLD37_02555 [Candidatus Bilamarchaeum sp.]|nr:hypothetical protein [Candidatus Bilamarchaeum sp.]